MQTTSLYQVEQNYSNLAMVGGTRLQTLNLEKVEVTVEPYD